MATIEVSKLENNSIQINIDNNEENNYIAKKDTRIAELEGANDQLIEAGNEMYEESYWYENKWQALVKDWKEG